MKSAVEKWKFKSVQYTLRKKGSSKNSKRFFGVGLVGNPFWFFKEPLTKVLPENLTLCLSMEPESSFKVNIKVNLESS